MENSKTQPTFNLTLNSTEMELISRALKISAAELADSHPTESKKFQNLKSKIKFSNFGI
jgi:hypothetical protein